MEPRELREKLAQNINFEGALHRVMAFRFTQNYEEGQQLTLGQCWTNGGDYQPETDMFGKYKYLFICENGKGFKIDYDELTEDEMYILGCEDCESENEVLVSKDQIFEIVSVNSTDEDFAEMGFYEIKVKMI